MIKKEIRNYILIDKLGVGSYGIVYLVTKKDTKLNELQKNIISGQSKFTFMNVLKENVQKNNTDEINSNRASKDYYVLKQISLYNLSNEEIKEVNSEANILSSINCEYVVKYIESFIEDNNLYIIMEYCEGGDLSKYLKLFNSSKKVHENNFIKNTKFNNNLNNINYLSDSKIWSFFIQISLGLYYLHSKKILHRDIKSLNIFITKKGVAKLGDLGVAKVLSSSFANTFVGTPYYLSPEMCEEKPYNEKSDVWALGCILYELITFKHPFNALNQGALIIKIIKGKYEPLPNCFANSDLKKIVDLILEKNYHKRPFVSDILTNTIVINKAKTYGLIKEIEKTGLIKIDSINNTNSLAESNLFSNLDKLIAADNNEKKLNECSNIQNKKLNYNNNNNLKIKIKPESVDSPNIRNIKTKNKDSRSFIGIIPTKKNLDLKSNSKDNLIVNKIDLLNQFNKNNKDIYTKEKVYYKENKNSKQTKSKDKLEQYNNAKKMNNNFVNNSNNENKNKLKLNIPSRYKSNNSNMKHKIKSNKNDISIVEQIMGSNSEIKNNIANVSNYIKKQELDEKKEIINKKTKAKHTSHSNYKHKINNNLNLFKEDNCKQNNKVISESQNKIIKNKSSSKDVYYNNNIYNRFLYNEESNYKDKALIEELIKPKKIVKKQKKLKKDSSSYLSTAANFSSSNINKMANFNNNLMLFKEDKYEIIKTEADSLNINEEKKETIKKYKNNKLRNKYVNINKERKLNDNNNQNFEDSLEGNKNNSLENNNIFETILTNIENFSNLQNTKLYNNNLLINNEINESLKDKLTDNNNIFKKSLYDSDNKENNNIVKEINNCNNIEIKNLVNQINSNEILDNTNKKSKDIYNNLKDLLKKEEDLLSSTPLININNTKIKNNNLESMPKTIKNNVFKDINYKGSINGEFKSEFLTYNNNNNLRKNSYSDNKSNKKIVINNYLKYSNSKNFCSFNKNSKILCKSNSYSYKFNNLLNIIKKEYHLDICLKTHKSYCKSSCQLFMNKMLYDTFKNQTNEILVNKNNTFNITNKSSVSSQLFNVQNRNTNKDIYKYDSENNISNKSNFNCKNSFESNISKENHNNNLFEIEDTYCENSYSNNKNEEFENTEFIDEYNNLSKSNYTNKSNSNSFEEETEETFINEFTNINNNSNILNIKSNLNYENKNILSKRESIKQLKIDANSNNDLDINNNIKNSSILFIEKQKKEHNCKNKEILFNIESKFIKNGKLAIIKFLEYYNSNKDNEEIIDKLENNINKFIDINNSNSNIYNKDSIIIDKNNYTIVILLMKQYIISDIYMSVLIDN